MGDGIDHICVRVVDGLQQRSLRRIPQADRFIVTAGDEASVVGGEGEIKNTVCVSLQGVHVGETVGDAVHVDIIIDASCSKHFAIGAEDYR